MKRSCKLITALALAMLLLSACGGSGTGGSGDTVTYITAEADGNGNLVIDTSSTTEYATYVNYKADDVTIQLLLVRDGDGELHYAFNTCQVCSPSPKAYFVQDGSAFICQNCGNSFDAEEVGEAQGGCNPANIADLTEREDALVIPVQYLEQYSGSFAGWQGPTGL